MALKAQFHFVSHFCDDFPVPPSRGCLAYVKLQRRADYSMRALDKHHLTKLLLRFVKAVIHPSICRAYIIRHILMLRIFYVATYTD